MASILVATGFVRIDADTSPALKAIQGFGGLAGTALTSTLLPATTAVTAALGAVAASAAAAGAAAGAFGAAVIPQFTQMKEVTEKQTAAEDAKTKATVQSGLAQELARKYGFKYGQQVKITSDMSAEARQRAQEYNSALSSSQSAAKAATTAQALFKTELNQLPPATRQTTIAFGQLQSDFQEWSDSLSGDTMPIFTRGIEFLRGLLPKLTPVVKSVSQTIEGFVASLGPGSLASGVFQEFGRNVTENGAGALRTFLDVSKNIVVGITGILNAFMPMSTQVGGGLESLTEKFALWGATLGQSEGFARFQEIARDIGPQLVETLGSLARAFGDVLSAAGPLSGISLVVLKVFADIVDAIPTPVLQALVPAIIAVNTALKLYAIYQAAATAATWLFGTSVTASTGTVYASRAALILHRIAVIASTIATAALTAATWLWTAAMTAARVAVAIMRAALVALRVTMTLVRVAVILTTTAFRALAIAIISNPIGLIITALIALAGVFYLLWTRSETFRNIVKGALNGVKEAALAVGRFFSGPFVDFFVGAWTAIYNNFLAPIGRFFTKTVPNWAKTLKRLVAEAWANMLTALANTFTSINTRVFQPIGRFFTATIPGWGRTVRNKVRTAWYEMLEGLAETYGSINKRIFQPIGRFFTKTIPGWAKSMKDKVKGFFREMRDGVGDIWKGIQSKTKTPINWVIRNVWNGGIYKIWDKITGWVGLNNKLKTLKELAAGGTVGAGFGQRATPGVFNRPTAIVGEGNPNYPEFVIPTDPKYRGRARNLWNAAGAQLMADGGVIGWIKDKAADVTGSVAGNLKGAGDFLTDPVGKAKELLAGPLNKMKSLTNSAWVSMVKRLPTMAVKGLVDKIKDAASSIFGGGDGGGGGGGGGNGGSGVQRWRNVVLASLAQVGQPASYADITLRRMQQESGGNPTIVNKWDSNWLAGHPSVGLMQVIGPTFRSYAGKYRKTGPFLYGVSTNPLANVYASMRYALAAYGSLPRAYNRAGGYRNGTDGAVGGMHLFGEAGPELGFSPSGWRILNARRTAGVIGSGGVRVERLVVENHGVIASQQEAYDWLTDALDQLRRRGRL